MGGKLALSIKASIDMLPQLAGMPISSVFWANLSRQSAKLLAAQWQLIPGGEVTYFESCGQFRLHTTILRELPMVWK